VVHERRVVAVLPGSGTEGGRTSVGECFSTIRCTAIVKGILAAGALVVCLQANTWLRREDTRHKQGEFYILTLSTLLGMYFMIGAGNFLLFFIGLELASVPAAWPADRHVVEIERSGGSVEERDTIEHQAARKQRAEDVLGSSA